MNEGRRLYVGNLPFELENGGAISERVLEDRFKEFGTITDVVLMREPQSKRLRGFGFIEFDQSQSAESALVMDRTDFHGRTLTVQIASPRRNGGPQRSEHAHSGTSDR